MASRATQNTSIKSFFSKAPAASQVAIGTGTSLSSMLVHATTLAKPRTPLSALSATSLDSHLPEISTIPALPHLQPSLLY